MRAKAVAEVRQISQYVTQDDIAETMTGVAIAFTRAMRVTVAETLLRNYAVALDEMARDMGHAPARRMMQGIAANLRESDPAH